MRHALDAALQFLEQHQDFLITSHISPDGDALGSALALSHLLRQAGKTTRVALQDPVPREYRLLPGADEVLQGPPEEPAEAAVVVDCENLGRVGNLGDAVRRSRRLLVIDHHISQMGFGDVEVRDPTAAACAEIIFHLAEARGALKADVAQCLMAGLILDTGCFRFPNVTPATLRIAARLVEAGARIPALYRSIYENLPYSAVKLQGLALASLAAEEGGTIHYATLTRQDFEKAGADESETNGIVNQILSVEGTSVALLFREAQDGSIRVSLRSRCAVDVNLVARTFGGGGHQQAAGCTLQAPLQEAVHLVLEETRRQASRLSSTEAEPPKTNGA